MGFEDVGIKTILIKMVHAVTKRLFILPLFVAFSTLLASLVIDPKREWLVDIFQYMALAWFAISGLVAMFEVRLDLQRKMKR